MNARHPTRAAKKHANPPKTRMAVRIHIPNALIKILNIKVVAHDPGSLFLYSSPIRFQGERNVFRIRENEKLFLVTENNRLSKWNISMTPRV